jgi:hypothetical protein
MQTATFIQWNLVHRGTAASQAPQLKVVVVYEDFQMGLVARELFDRMVREAGARAARLTLWRFDFFHAAELTHALTRQAAEADVIIVAVRDPHSLPPQVRAWLERWPLRRKPGVGALVGLFAPGLVRPAQTSRVACQLRRAAAQAKIDFFCCTGRAAPPVGGPSAAPFRTPAPAGAGFFAPDAKPTAPGAWGLSD